MGKNIFLSNSTLQKQNHDTHNEVGNLGTRLGYILNF